MSLYIFMLCLNVGVMVVESVLPPVAINTLFPAPTDEITLTVDVGTDGGLFLDDTNVVIAEHINSGSALYGKAVDSVTLGLKKSGSPTGTAFVCIFNSSGECSTVFGSVDVSTLTTSYTQRIFAHEVGTLVVGSRIGIGYADGTALNKVGVATSTTDQFDGTNSALNRYTTSWQADDAGDLGSADANGAWVISTRGDFVDCETASANATNYCQFISGSTEGASAISSLQSTLTFGDWYTGAIMFFNIFTMGYLMDLLALVAFPPAFIFGMKLVFLFLISLGLFYIITGRGTKPSI